MEYAEKSENAWCSCGNGLSQDWSRLDSRGAWNATDNGSSSMGDSHPGSVHLGKLVDVVKKSVYEQGGRPAQYTVTDICDGIAQGHDGMNYSLISREMIVNTIEVQINATPHKHNACPSCGSCQFMGTAATMQVMAEALGIALPGSALVPAVNIINVCSGFEQV